jgi:hypothetical protein
VIRTPTPLDAQLAWHRAAMAGVYAEKPVTFSEIPQCGWFKRKLVKGGVFVPAKIWLFSPTDPETGELCGDERLQCEVGGAFADPADAWPWLCSNPISEADFGYLMAVRDWAAWYATDQPQANPKQPIDWTRVALPQFTRSATA